MAHRTIRVFTGIFDTVSIRRDQPLEAIRIVIKALRNGEVVCLFPEGQLTRTGTLCPLERGFELIAKKAGHPVFPVWCDGSWGSIFSFERNRFFRKKPRRFGHGITVAFGHQIPANEISIGSVRDGLLQTSAEAVARRFSGRGWGSRKPRAKNPAVAAFAALDSNTRRRMWVNGHQIGMVNALQRRAPFNVLSDDPLLTSLPGLFVAFSELFGAELRVNEIFDGEEDGIWVGSDHLRALLQTTQITSEIVFYDFGTRVLRPVERAGVIHCPCLAVNGAVIAMSMPNPPKSNDTFDAQLGHKPHSWGKTLPGWFFKPAADGTLHAYGPAASYDGLPIPQGSALDDESFLVSHADLTK